MHKNPFLPTPAYPQHQPPLPPGPPPTAPAGYWQGPPGQPPPSAGGAHPAYNGSWPAPQGSSAPTPQQSALFANYGYGGQQQQWQQQQQQQATQQQRPHQAFMHPPPAPPASTPHPHMVPAYNPYQPQAAAPFPQPYPQPQPVPIPQMYQAPQAQMQPAQYFPQQPRPPGPLQAAPMANAIPHTPPHHLPPAKRQRFDRPGHTMMSNNRGPPMQQPSFTASGGSAPIGPQGSFTGGPPQGSSAVPMSAGRGGAPGHGANGLPAGPRGGGPGAMRGGPPLRGQKSGFVPPRGGGPQGMRGRGGGAMGASAPRGGMPMSGGPLRSHGSRGGFNGGRRGGFNGQGSFRARGGHAYGGRGPRGDAQSQGASEVPLGPSAAGNAGRKDENRRTLTDFKLVGFEFLELGWSWGVRPDPEPAEQSVKVEPEEDKDGSLPDAPSQSHVTDAGESTVADSGTAVKEELQEEESTALPVPPTDANPATSPEVTVPVRAPTPVLAATAAAKTEASPPSRLRIYFHTPASLDDARASSIPPSVILEGEGARPGKRKKGADGDDDDSAEEGRARPRPPGEEYDRGSVAPSVDMDGSVAPSIAESDWLMAAFGGEREHGADSGDGEHGADAERQRTEPLPDTVEGDTQPPVAEEADVHEDGAASQETVPDELPAHDESGVAPLDGVDARPEAGMEAAGEAAQPQPMSAGERPHEDVGSLETAPSEPAAAAALEALHVSDAGVGVDASPEVPVVVVSCDEVEAELDGSDSDEVPGLGVGVNASQVRDGAQNVERLGVGLGSGGDVAVKADGPSPQPTQDADAPATTTSQNPIRAEASLASTEPDVDGDNESETGVADLIANGALGSPVPTEEDVFEETQVAPGDESLALTATSDASATLFSLNTSALGDVSFASVSVSTKPDFKAVVLSANRLSISYAAGQKRLVLNADVVEKLKIFRTAHRIEAQIRVERTDSGDLKGISVEELSEETKSYRQLDSESADSSDPTVPPFSDVETPSTITLVVHLDSQRPLSEPKWVRTGDVQEWLKSIFGRMFWAAGDAADGWERRIEVVDPDPPPTLWTTLESWAENSSVGQDTERQRFLKTHMSEIDNILEILLRLVRGERATSHSSSSNISASNLSGPLLSALTEGTAHGSQQTHVSLAVLAMFRMTIDYAKQCIGEKGKAEAEARVSEIIRALPTHLVYKSLDGIFKEWKSDKRGAR